MRPRDLGEKEEAERIDNARRQFKDSSFFHLERLVKLGFTEVERLSSDETLKALHGDPRWQHVLDGVTRNREK